jgi:hypothetical protein
MMEALRSCETSVRARATRSNIPEESILPFLNVLKMVLPYIFQSCGVNFKGLVILENVVFQRISYNFDETKNFV